MMFGLTGMKELSVLLFSSLLSAVMQLYISCTEHGCSFGALWEHVMPTCAGMHISEASTLAAVEGACCLTGLRNMTL